MHNSGLVVLKAAQETLAEECQRGTSLPTCFSLCIISDLETLNTINGDDGAFSAYLRNLTEPHTCELSNINESH